MQATAVTLACLGLLLSDSLALAQQPEQEPATFNAMDLALQAPGCIVGTILDQAGQPCADKLVTVQSQQQVIAQIHSDDMGHFACTVPGGGTYLLQVDNQVAMLRCWLPGTAPPQAVTQLLLQHDSIVRGQVGPAGCGLGSPWVITGIVATAIVVPIVIHNHRADRDPGS